MSDDLTPPHWGTDDWRNDPESSEAWCAGNQHALDRLCVVVKADPAKVVWDGSDDSLNEETDALIWLILRHDEDNEGRSSAERDAEALARLRSKVEAAEKLAEVEKLKAERDELRERVRALSFMGEGYVFVERRAEAADAEVARLREVVRYYGEGTGDMGEYARAALLAYLTAYKEANK